MNQSASQQQHGKPLVIDALRSKLPALELRSPAFSEKSAIPQRFSAEGENQSPALEWEKGPEHTQTFALVVEDPDAPQEEPFVHWVLYNVPADVTSTKEGIPDRPVLNVPQEALQGLNDRGNLGYFGPLPPEGHGTHHYHFQLFALDRILDLHYGATRNQLLAAMQGHVLGAGDLVGTYER